MDRLFFFPSLPTPANLTYASHTAYFKRENTAGELEKTTLVRQGFHQKFLVLLMWKEKLKSCILKACLENCFKSNNTFPVCLPYTKAKASALPQHKRVTLLLLS